MIENPFHRNFGCGQVPDDWQLGVQYTVADNNQFSVHEIVIIQRSDGRRTFAEISRVFGDEYDCKVRKQRSVFVLVSCDLIALTTLS